MGGCGGLVNTHAICDARSRTQCVTIYSLTDPKCGWFRKEIVTGKVNYKMENVQRHNKEVSINIFQLNRVYIFLRTWLNRVFLCERSERVEEKWCLRNGRAEKSGILEEGYNNK